MTFSGRTATVALAAMMIVATTCEAHWEPPPEMFPWADPGALRWVINYSGMDEAQVERLLAADFNLIQGDRSPPRRWRTRGRRARTG